jgi:hypothetical protein
MDRPYWYLERKLDQLLEVTKETKTQIEELRSEAKNPAPYLIGVSGAVLGFMGILFSQHADAWVMYIAMGLTAVATWTGAFLFGQGFGTWTAILGRVDKELSNKGTPTGSSEID